MVWEFVDVFKNVLIKDQIKDDDFTDRLNHRWTVSILLVFCLLVGSNQYVGSPIACWAPAHFSSEMIYYTNTICWISNTYYIPQNQTLPLTNTPRETKINYYQWVPFILAIMACFFYLPYAFWHLLSGSSGLDVKTIIKVMNTKDSDDSSELAIENTAKVIDRAISFYRGRIKKTLLEKIKTTFTSFIFLDKNSSSYISMSYIFIKLLYVLNVIGQFYLLNIFMGPKFNLYGFEVIQNLYSGKDFWESPRFPRITMCDFLVRTLGENNHKITIQCVLTINLFNEKIFMFIWFWMFFVGALSFVSFTSWLFKFTKSSRMNFIRKYLNTSIHFFDSRSLNKASEKELNIFVFKYLKQDGVFLLRIVKRTNNEIVLSELIRFLWENFKKSPKFGSHYNDD